MKCSSVGSKPPYEVVVGILCGRRISPTDDYGLSVHRFRTILIACREPPIPLTIIQLKTSQPPSDPPTKRPYLTFHPYEHANSGLVLASSHIDITSSPTCYVARHHASGLLCGISPGDGGGRGLDGGDWRGVVETGRHRAEDNTGILRRVEYTLGGGDVENTLEDTSVC